jgi:glycosyltransferase 2 family protein
VPPAPDTTPDRSRRRPTLLLKGLVSAGLMYWILRGTSLTEVVEAASNASVPLLLLAFSLHFVGYLISTQRWRVLLRAQGVEARLRTLLSSFMVAIFFNNFLPSTVGGDASRALDNWRFGTTKGGAVAVLFVDRFLGMVALMLFAVGALVIADTTTAGLPLPYFWIVGGSVAMLVVLAMIFVPARFHGGRVAVLATRLPPVLWKLPRKVLAAFEPFQGRTDALLRALGLSLLLQTNVVVYYFVIAKALGFPVPFLDFFLIVPLALAVMMLPISINAIGLRENAFAFFFAAFAVSRPEAIAFAWIAYGMLIVQGLMGGVVYALRKAPVRRAATEVGPAEIGVKSTPVARAG